MLDTSKLLPSLIGTSAVSINSLEIADLVKSRPDGVKRTIERLAGRGVIQLPPTQKVENKRAASTNNKTEVYVFDLAHKRDSFVVVAKLAPQAIGDIIDRWGRTETALQELLDALSAFDVPDDLPHGMFVYAIRETESGRIKLGISRDPRERLSQLQTGNSQRLELIAYRPAVNRFADERAIHADAEAYRLRGEWFSAHAAAAIQ